MIENGDVAGALLQAIEGGKAHDAPQASDLLALTTHGRSGIQRWVLGSVAEQVLQGSTLPLLVVLPPKPRPEWMVGVLAGSTLVKRFHEVHRAFL